MHDDSKPALALIPDDYDVVGELGRTGEGVAAYLARAKETGELVAVRVEPSSDPSHPRVTVSRTLGSNVPAAPRTCPSCRTAIADWRRYCPHCGVDLAGAEDPRPGADPAWLENAVRQAAHVELLGRMKREEGGGAVYFGQDRRTGEVVALDLRRREPPGDPPVPLTFEVSTVLRRAERAPGADPRSVAPVASTGTAGASTTGSGYSTAAPGGEGQTKVCPACGNEFDARIRFCPDDGTVLRLKAQAGSLIGQVIAERYHVTRLIGRGGMGQVYHAEHVRMGRPCAIKVMNRALSNDVAAVARFTREAANASRINDDNVAHIYDFGETPEHGIYLAMEFVDGETLGAIIQREAPLAPERVIALGTQVAKALAAAHREGVVHRDLTPNNVMVTRTPDDIEFVKVVDFGIAKAMQDEGSGITRTGYVVGTPQYMSPEQLIAGPLDGRTDIYSLGCILYELLAGQSPFGGAGVENLTRRLTDEAPHVRELNPAVPAALDDVVTRALARDPEQRFQSALELREALQQAALAPAAGGRFGWLRRRGRGAPAGTHRTGSGPRAATPAGGTARARTPSGPRPAAPSGGSAARTPTPPGPRPAQGGPAAGPSAPATPVAQTPAAPVPPAAGTPRSTPAPWGASAVTPGPPGSPVLPGTPSGPVAGVSAPAAFGAGPGYAGGTGAMAETAAGAGGGGAGGTRTWLVRGGLIAVAAVVVLVVYGTLVSPIRIGPLTLGFGRTPTPLAAESDGGAVAPTDAGASGEAATNTASTETSATVAGAPPETTSTTEANPATAPEPEPTGVRLTGALPAGAGVRANGRSVALAGGFLALPAGTHDLEVRAPGHQPATRRFTLSEGQTMTWTPRLEPVVAAAPPAGGARPDSAARTDTAGRRVATPDPPPPMPFDRMANEQVDAFRRSLEAKSLGAIRRYLTQAQLTEFSDVLARSGSAPIRVTVYDFVPDSARSRAGFLLRIDTRDGTNLMGFGEFEAEFMQVGGSWQLFAVQRKQ